MYLPPFDPTTLDYYNLDQRMPDLRPGVLHITARLIKPSLHLFYFKSLKLARRKSSHKMSFPLTHTYERKISVIGAQFQNRYSGR